MLSDLQLFEFDLQGFLIVRNFFHSEQIAKVNAVLARSGESLFGGKKFEFMTLDPVFMDIMSDRRILEINAAWIDPHFRFDHAWGIHQPPRSSPPKERAVSFHAGPNQNQKFFEYQWLHGKPACSCLVFTVVLTPQRKGDGGLVLIPGSHKTNVDMSGYSLNTLLREHDIEMPSWAVQPELEPGDLVIFTEALVHGTHAWQPPDRRRCNLYYKYSRSFMTWLPSETPENQFLREHARDELERRLVEPPYVSSMNQDKLDWRPATLDTSPGHLHRAKSLLKSLLK